MRDGIPVSDCPKLLRAAPLLVAAVLACGAGAAPFVYVTNGSNNTVQVIDEATNTVIKTIAVGQFPESVAVSGTSAYVVNDTSNSISVISTASNAVTATIPTGASPTYIAINPQGTFAYLALYGANAVSAINLATNTVTATVPVAAAYKVAINPSGTTVYATGAAYSNTVSVISTATNTVTGTIPVGLFPTGMAINPADTFGYVSNYNGDTVSVVNLATKTVTATIPVPGNPHNVSINPGGTFAYVVQAGNNSVAVINTATNTVTKTIPVGLRPLNLAINAAGTFAYVANQSDNTVSVINLATNTVTATIPVAAAPTGIATAVLPAAPASPTSPPPVFPVTVNVTNPTPTTVAATAQIQPRSQDVGSRANVFVFAHAPSNLVRGATTTRRVPVGSPWPAVEDDAIVCVLAQVVNGELVGVKPETMKEFLKDVVLAQTAQVQILDSVRIQAVAGATMFVGYGASAAAMLSNGVYQTALSVAGGAVQCASSQDSAPVPKAPGALSGLYWNAAEPGWGITFTQRGTNIFAAWYTYDLAGNAKWYVSTCALPSSSATTCTGQIFEVGGPRFFGVAFDASLVHATPAGSLQVTFPNTNTATMTYSGVAGVTRTVALTRQPLATGTTSPAIDYTDLWWNSRESGWGMSITHQYGIAFLAWYVFDANGAATWHVATCTMSGSSCSGTLYQTRGPGFAGTFNPSLVQAIPIGSVVVSFVDANNAVLSYLVNGVSSSKTIARQLF